MRIAPLFALLALAATAPCQAPKVKSITPRPGDVEVDAATTTELVVVFDRDMNTRGMSVMGGGETFPKLDGRPVWRDKRTFVMKVRLQPDHEYRMSLNGPKPRNRNFRSVNGESLQPVPWSFVTLPKDLPDPKQQRARNRSALDKLLEVLPARYSYYDLRVKDWNALVEEWRDKLLAARTDRGFASLAARMMYPANDPHLYLKCGGSTFNTRTEYGDSLYRDKLLPRYVTVKKVASRAWAGRTDDNLGYLLIASWTMPGEIEKIEAAIAEMKDAKALIIDVRPNGGGDELQARQVASWFVKGEKVYAKHRVRIGKGADGFGTAQSRKISGHGGDRHYKKAVALLIGGNCMSSCEAFTLMMKQAEDCVVVGQPTFGSSGNPQPVDLGNGVTVMVPCWQAMQPDGSLIEGVGIQPDELVPCTPKDLQRRDPILEKALEIMRARVGE